MYETLVLDRPEDGIVVATLNRPERMNALTFAAFAELRELAEEIGADDSVRVLILTGAGRGFCAGLDLGDAARLTEMSVPEMFAGQEQWAAAIAALRRMPTPVIAAVNGAAAGAGFGLALAADIRIASPQRRASTPPSCGSGCPVATWACRGCCRGSSASGTPPSCCSRAG